MQLLIFYKTICIQDVNDNNFDEVSKLIFNEYFILGNLIHNISLKHKIQIKLINNKIEYLNKFINKYFVK